MILPSTMPCIVANHNAIIEPTSAAASHFESAEKANAEIDYCERQHEV